MKTLEMSQKVSAMRASEGRRTLAHVGQSFSKTTTNNSTQYNNTKGQFNNTNRPSKFSNKKSFNKSRKTLNNNTNISRGFNKSQNNSNDDSSNNFSGSSNFSNNDGRWRNMGQQSLFRKEQPQSSFRKEEHQSSFRKEQQQSSFGKEQQTSFRKEKQQSSFRKEEQQSSFRKEEQQSSFKKVEHEPSLRKEEEASNKKSGKNSGPVEMPLRRKAAPPLWQLKKKIAPERVIRDPRFDDLSGKLDTAAWSKNYQFIAKMKAKERKHLAEELKTTQDTEERTRIKLAIQRIDNQYREKKMEKQASIRKTEQRKITIEALKQGKKPYFKKNSDTKLEMLAAHFHTLKKEHRLDKYLERKEKGKRAKELFS